LCLHCPDEELEDKRTTLGFFVVFGDVMAIFIRIGATEGSEPKALRNPANPSVTRTMTPRTLTELPTATRHKATSKPSFYLDANPPAFIPSRSFLSQCSALEDQSDTEINSSLDGFDSGPESLDTDDFAFQYARLRLQHDQLTSTRKIDRKVDATVVHELDMRLDALKNSYFFDEQEAEALYEVERSKVHEQALQDQLRGVASLTYIDGSIPSLQRPHQLQLQRSTAPAATPDIFDDDSGDSTTGGIFELLDDMPTIETDAQGKTIIVRDMGNAQTLVWSHTQNTTEGNCCEVGPLCRSSIQRHIRWQSCQTS